MKNSFFNSFVPKQPNFFCLLKQLADILSEAADVLTESVEQGKPEERETYYRRVKEVERKGDMVTHQVLDELETTFITPLDREDINALASGIDDVIDRETVVPSVSIFIIPVFWAIVQENYVISYSKRQLVFARRWKN